MVQTKIVSLDIMDRCDTRSVIPSPRLIKMDKIYRVIPSHALIK